MPAQRIAENLAFINWIVLAGLGLGSFAIVALARFRTDATRGYLAFTAFCAAAFGVLAWLSDGGLSEAAAAPGATVSIDPGWDGPRRVALLGFALLAAAYTVVLARRGRAPLLAGGALSAGAAAFAFGALGWTGGSALAGALGAPLATALVVGWSLVLALVCGGFFAAMILGHWYLVTPKLPEGPLVLVSRFLLALVVVQVALFVVSVALGAGSGAGAFAPLTVEWALFVWLRLIVGLLFPLGVTWAAVQTARSRSMESATGLLYIDVGSIAAGTILAAGLYFGAGLIL